MTTWRSYSLDDAILLFDRASGTNLRVQNEFTRGQRRAAPRVVMFAITNRCNLTCSFCSRDTDTPSQWTVDAAFEMLAGLAAQGTLEIAFGGGEPLAFRGFDRLVLRLANETSLALHVTTNGVLLTPERADRLRHAIGEFRLSVYDDNPWQETAAMLRDRGMRVGLNVLVTPARLIALPAILQHAAALGVRDVAVLSYLGDDASLRLTPHHDAALAAIIAASPVPSRVSVCMGDRLDPLPRLTPLHLDGDCGAGRDFVVITADQKLKQCSFSDGGIAVANASDVVRAWEQHAAVLAAPVARGGCARATASLPAAPRAAPLDGIAIWNSFSANNSGDCTLVGQFDTATAAEAFAEALLRHFSDQEMYKEALQSVLAAAGMTPGQNLSRPHAIAQLGRNVMVHGYDAEDQFPELRELTWRRGGKAIHNGIHLHESVGVLAVFDVAAARTEALAEALWMLDGAAVVARGDEVIAWLPIDGESGDPTALDAVTAQLKTLAAQHGATVAGELATFDQAATPAATVAQCVQAMIHAMQTARQNTDTWLWATFKDSAAATQYATTIGPTVITVDRYLLWPHARSSGLIAQMLATGASVSWWQCDGLTFEGYWSPPPVAPQRGTKAPKPELPFDAGGLQQELRVRVGAAATIGIEPTWSGLRAVVTGGDPRDVLHALAGIAQARNVGMWLSASPARELPAQLVRLRQDLSPRRAE
jgi:MoaA/NifB/PqqE/SkfB family radical SAM enzyme